MTTPNDSLEFWTRFTSPSNLRFLAIMLVVIFCVRWSIAAPYHVPTISMEPTIRAGDRLLANHLAYHFRLPFSQFIVWHWAKPERGDLVLFQSLAENERIVIKRVIAVPGDVVSFTESRIELNGRLLTQAGVVNDSDDEFALPLLKESLGSRSYYVVSEIDQSEGLDSPTEPTFSPQIEVPADTYFVVGDNRPNSLDSRHWGVVPRERILGKLSRVLWSWDSNTPGWLINDKFRKDRLLLPIN